MGEIWLVKYRNDVVNPGVRDASSIQYKYVIRNVENFRYDIATPVSPAPLPEEGAEENILVKLEGNTSRIKYTWVLTDEAQNAVSNSPSRTVAEKVIFFRRRFAPVSIEDSYAFVYIFDSSSTLTDDNNITFEGTFSNIGFATSGDAPVTLKATADFMEGLVISIHDPDTLPPPQNFGVVVSGRAITVNWDQPVTDDQTVSGYELGLSRGTTYIERSVSSTSRTVTFTGLSPGTYTVTLRAVSSNGVKGKPISREARVV